MTERTAIMLMFGNLIGWQIGLLLGLWSAYPPAWWTRWREERQRAREARKLPSELWREQHPDW